MRPGARLRRHRDGSGDRVRARRRGAGVRRDRRGAGKRARLRDSRLDQLWPASDRVGGPEDAAGARQRPRGRQPERNDGPRRLRVRLRGGRVREPGPSEGRAWADRRPLGPARGGSRPSLHASPWRADRGRDHGSAWHLLDRPGAGDRGRSGRAQPSGRCSDACLLLRARDAWPRLLRLGAELLACLRR